MWLILASKYRYKRILSEISKKSLLSWCKVSTKDNGKLLLSVLEVFNLGTKYWFDSGFEISFNFFANHS